MWSTRWLLSYFYNHEKIHLIWYYTVCPRSSYSFYILDSTKDDWNKIIFVYISVFSVSLSVSALLSLYLSRSLSLSLSFSLSFSFPLIVPLSWYLPIFSICYFLFFLCSFLVTLLSRLFVIFSIFLNLSFFLTKLFPLSISFL